ARSRTTIWMGCDGVGVSTRRTLPGSVDARARSTGRVTELHRWPVKSLAGEPVDVLRVDPRGAAGDRAHALTHTHKGATRLLTAREAPRMLAWSATYGGADVVHDGPPEPVLTAPDG